MKSVFEELLAPAEEGLFDMFKRKKKAANSAPEVPTKTRPSYAAVKATMEKHYEKMVDYVQKAAGRYNLPREVFHPVFSIDPFGGTFPAFFQGNRSKYESELMRDAKIKDFDAVLQQIRKDGMKFLSDNKLPGGIEIISATDYNGEKVYQVYWDIDLLDVALNG